MSVLLPCYIDKEEGCVSRPFEREVVVPGHVRAQGRGGCSLFELFQGGTGEATG